MKKLFVVFSILVLTFLGAHAQMNGMGSGNNGGNGSGMGTTGGNGGSHGGGMGTTGGNGGSHGGGMGTTGGNGGSHGGGMGSMQSMSNYDLNSIITISGEITEISTDNFNQNMNFSSENHGMITFNILTEDSTIYNVMVAPVWYLENQNIQFNVGDYLSILGSYSTYDQNNITNNLLIAGTITKDDIVFSLRDDYGRPLWAGTMGSGNHNGNQGYFMDFVYDLNEEVVLTATVNSTFIGPMGENKMNFGYQLSVTLENGSTLNVMLAPYWYLLNQGFSLEEGTEIQLTGVYFNFGDEITIFITRQLEFDDTVIILRDETGLPLWQCIRYR